MKSRTDFEPMREREPLRVMLTLEFPTPTPLPNETSNINVHVASKRKTRNRTIWQFVRFWLVGCLLEYHHQSTRAELPAPALANAEHCEAPALQYHCLRFWRTQ